MRFIVGHAAAEAQLVILENHGQIERESDFFAPDHERVVAYEYAVALNADVRGLILGADLNLLLGRAIIVESPEQATRSIVVTGLEIAQLGEGAVPVNGDADLPIAETVAAVFSLRERLLHSRRTEYREECYYDKDNDHKNVLFHFVMHTSAQSEK